MPMPRTDKPHRLYVHFAWTTLARVPMLDDSRRASIESHLMAACRWVGAEPIEVCVLPDRVHLLVRIPSGLAVGDLARRARTSVEELLGSAGRVVRWSRTFAAATVSPRDVRRVRRRLASLGLDRIARGDAGFRREPASSVTDRMRFDPTRRAPADRG